ncbi:MAG: OmpA family protein [Myxococcales bacterium]|jgi:OOP family OmpA-OmpF porin|nr:OmpA family protein [Myxococcales bacterium]
MKKRIGFTLCVLSACGLMAGCSFSASFGNVHTIEGKDAILVNAAQPELPPPPPEPVPEPPVKKAQITEKKIEILEKVMFDYNKATIKEESHQLLSDVADVLKENPKVLLINIEGHTDADGADKYNKELSQKRAEAVKEHLVGLGIDEARLNAIGYGKERPIADNNTEEGKEKNRRVEFIIAKTEKASSVKKLSKPKSAAGE